MRTEVLVVQEEIEDGISELKVFVDGIPMETSIETSLHIMEVASFLGMKVMHISYKPFRCIVKHG